MIFSVESDSGIYLVRVQQSENLIFFIFFIFSTSRLFSIFSPTYAKKRHRFYYFIEKEHREMGGPETRRGHLRSQIL